MRQQLFETALKRIVSNIETAYAALPEVPDTIAEMGVVERIQEMVKADEIFARLLDETLTIANEALDRKSDPEGMSK